ncbi:response regulator transcription factor [bacterium]|nr:response regulator transcription factor [bacterium]
MNGHTSKSIWIIEDDPGVRFVYEEVLALRYSLTFLQSVEEFCSALETRPRPDLLLADLRLPGESFLQFLKGPHSAARIAGIPFVVLSSVDDLDTLRSCFELGARDFLTKPIGKGELIVKLERLLAGEAAPEPLFQLDSIALNVIAHGKKNRLTAKEFQILSIFHASPGYQVSRDEILKRVWNDVAVDSKTLDVHLSSLRKKISELGLEIAFLPSGSYRLQSCVG